MKKEEAERSLSPSKSKSSSKKKRPYSADRTANKKARHTHSEHQDSMNKTVSFDKEP
jgi:hypothetical protein